MSATTYDYFWELASLDSSIRKKAASELITHLYEKFNNSKANIDSTDDFNDFPKVTELLEKLFGPEIAYSLIRLTRGLASPRAGARQGFALALTELLANLDRITFKIIITLIDEACPISASKDQEGLDIIFGRVFGYMAIIRSGILWRESSSEKDYCETINGLLACAKCKPYVKEACYHIIISSIPQLKMVSFEEEAISHLITILQDHCIHGISNPDDVNLALTIEAQYPRIIDNSQWKKVILHSCKDCEFKWLNPHILHHDNLIKLSEAIKAKSGKSVTETQQNYENRMHSVWNTIIQWFISESHEENMITFETFWKVVVDECLFHEDSTHHRKFWGFQLFEKALISLPLEKMPSIFTPNLLRTLMNSFLDKTRYLHEAAMHVLSIFEQVVEENNDKALIIVMQLLSHSYNRNFNGFFNTKIIKKIFGAMDNEALEQYLLHLKKIFLHPNEIHLSENRSIEQHRQWIMNHVYTLLKDHHVKRHEGFLKSVLDFYTMYGFFISKEIESHPKTYNTRSSKRLKLDSGTSTNNVKMVDNSEEVHVLIELPKPELSEKTQKCLRARFFHALGELCTIRSSDKEMSTHQLYGTMTDGVSWAYYAVNLMKKYYDDSRIEPLIILSDEAQKIKNDVIILLQQITNKVSSKSSKNDPTSTLQYKGFILLFSFSILTLYNEPDESMNALKDLRICYDRMFDKKKKPSKKLKNTSESDQNMHNPADVIVDILLGYLAKPSSFLHNMSEQIFKIFCANITKSSFDVMIELLNKKKDSEDDQMMDIDDDGVSDDDFDDESIDEELYNINLEVKESKTPILKAIDEGSDDDKDDILENQDEIMGEVDSKLMAYFKQQKLEKTKKKDAKNQRIQFKHKIIGLLRIFVQSQPTNPLIFELFIPLLELAKNAKNDEIAKSAFSLVSTKVSVIKNMPSQFDSDRVLTLLQQTHNMALKASYCDLAALCWKTSTFLLKSLILKCHNNGSGDESLDKDLKKAISIYESTYEKWIKKSGCLHIKSFSELPNHVPKIPWHITNIFLGFTDPKTVKNPKKVMNAYDISASIFNNVAPKKRKEQLDDSVMNALVQRSRESLKVTLQFVSQDLQCGKKNFDPQTLKSVMKFAILTMKSTSVNVSKDKIKSTWDADHLLPLLESIKELPRYKSSQIIRNPIDEIIRIIS
ncbi:DNA-directed DNA polymerase [Gigaspora margarita]|uniref:DNA-directed DNA polymerase n=1 Tax=Gigaspora margarita TaxID=4874 RepID=A0A8H3XHH2_GIGMA|nr:DNA-directed DNA polymerase [Gigaspora margarita]